MCLLIVSTFLGVESAPLELEISSDTAFVFYKKDTQVVFRRWAASNWSPEQIVETSAINANHLGGINIVSNSTTDNFLFYNRTDRLIKIEKSTLTQTLAIPFGGNYDIFDHKVLDDTLYFVGKSPTSQQCLVAIDLQGGSLSWQQV